MSYQFNCSKKCRAIFRQVTRAVYRSHAKYREADADAAAAFVSGSASGIPGSVQHPGPSRQDTSEQSVQPAASPAMRFGRSPSAAQGVFPSRAPPTPPNYRPRAASMEYVNEDEGNRVVQSRKWHSF
ncbi:hypothetical protein PAXRUDRAFT_561338 [Paxillus rubicundulus Ve08.2h10]|uniref:Unplaced genomic scaffold scaffold_4329, whole genome shotgun sequence n=1 Tax=Paxillus rubicundulus Ve08.2h10 TaxID=930991 RepID=A0A0D0CFB6_9AGAM|nr:hypothetical protein PAXRUDRAFT_561338 [Paxillus rubicundulus Ve08.2h10]